jgi:RHS repeat-associated protein
VAQRIDYDEFGNVLRDTRPGFQPFGFQGGLYDRDTGLVRFGARDYDPTIGRWLTKDPLGFEAGLNFYAFCGNDPVNRIDPFGLKMDINLDGDPGSDRIKVDGNRFNVAGHGNGWAMFSDDKPGYNPDTTFTAHELAEMISSHPDYSSGQSVVLWGCNTADEGNRSLGQRLANLLGVMVTAPDATLRVMPNGWYWLGGPFDFLTGGNGSWIDFYPEGDGSRIDFYSGGEDGEKQ